MKKLITCLVVFIAVGIYAAYPGDTGRICFKTESGESTYTIRGIMSVARVARAVSSHYFFKEKQYEENGLKKFGYTEKTASKYYYWVMLESQYYPSTIIIVPKHRYKAFLRLMKKKCYEFRYVDEVSGIRAFDWK